MSNKEIYENSIILIGPSCVGKTLISKELSARTQMPVFSVDDILFFLAEMRNNGLKNTHLWAEQDIKNFNNILHIASNQSKSPDMTKKRPPI